MKVWFNMAYEVLNLKKPIVLEVKSNIDMARPAWLSKFDVLMVQRLVGPRYTVVNCARSTDDTLGWWDCAPQMSVEIPPTSIQSSQALA